MNEVRPKVGDVPLYPAACRLRPDLPDPQNGLERLNRPSLVAMREAFNGRDFEAAIEHGSTATRIDANCLEAWRTVARAHFNRSDVTKALDAFRHCTMLQPEDGRNWLTQGLMLNHAGDRPAALAAFQKAKQFSGPADAELRSEAESSIAALHPQLVRDAQQAADAGDLELAWRCCEAAGAIRPDNSGIDRLKRRLLRALREQIRLLWEAQSASVAALCRQYLEKSPSDRYAATVLGRTLMGTRAYAEALPVWKGCASRALTTVISICRWRGAAARSRSGTEAWPLRRRRCASIHNCVRRPRWPNTCET